MTSFFQVPSTKPQKSAYWLCQLIGWGGLVIVFTIVGIANDPGLLRSIWLFDWISFGISGLIASHIYYKLIIHRSDRPGGWRFLSWVGARLFLAVIAMWGLRGLCVISIEPAPYNFPQWSNPLYIIEMAAAMGMWSALYFAYDYYTRYHHAISDRLRLDAALKEAQLQALKSQINPHFLFNSLNSLRALVPIEAQPAREAVSRLSGLLRAALAVKQRKTVPFSEELKVADDYLALQRLRFEERLCIRREIEPQALNWEVPPFLFQSLLENAIKFGVSPRENGGEIFLGARISGDHFQAIIKNPGRIAGWSNSTGVGLSNARERLEMLFGPKASLILRQEAPDVVAVEVAIPKYGDRLT